MSPAIVGPMRRIGRVFDDSVGSANRVKVVVDIGVGHVGNFDKFAVLLCNLDCACPGYVHVDSISGDVIAGQRGSNIAVGRDRQTETADHFFCARFARLQIAMIPFYVDTRHWQRT